VGRPEDEASYDDIIITSLNFRMCRLCVYIWGAGYVCTSEVQAMCIHLRCRLCVYRSNRI